MFWLFLNFCHTSWHFLYENDSFYIKSLVKFVIKKLDNIAKE